MTAAIGEERLRPRVILADHHPPLRAGVRAVLETDGFVVCAEVSDAQSAVAAARQEQPDVCLLDVAVPGGGIWAASQISVELPDIAVVMLTSAADDDSLFRAVRAGAAGYLLKDMTPDRLPDALRGVLAGEAAVPRGLTARLMSEFRSSGRGRRRIAVSEGASVSLTPREWEIADALTEGRNTAEIAHRLSIRPATVRGYVAGMVRRLGASDRRDLIQMLVRARWADTSRGPDPRRLSDH